MKLFDTHKYCFPVLNFIVCQSNAKILDHQSLLTIDRYFNGLLVYQILRNDPNTRLYYYSLVV